MAQKEYITHIYSKQQKNTKQNFISLGLLDYM